MTIYPEQDYLAFLKEGRFMLQRSRTSGTHVFYPRVSATARRAGRKPIAPPFTAPA